MDIELEGLIDKAVLKESVTKAVSDLFKGREDEIAKAILAKVWGNSGRRSDPSLTTFLNSAIKEAVAKEVQTIAMEWLASKREEIKTEVLALLEEQSISDRIRPVLDGAMRNFTEDVMRPVLEAAINPKKKGKPVVDEDDDLEDED